jgi:hypothetical protein
MVIISTSSSNISAVLYFEVENFFMVSKCESKHAYSFTLDRMQLGGKMKCLSTSSLVASTATIRCFGTLKWNLLIFFPCDDVYLPPMVN